MMSVGSEELLPILAGIDRVIHSPARLMVMTYLYVVESGDLVYLMHQTGLTWGNLSTHIGKLEAAGYIALEKKFVGRKPRTLLHLTEEGRAAYQAYRAQMKQVLDGLPD